MRDDDLSEWNSRESSEPGPWAPSAFKETRPRYTARKRTSQKQTKGSASLLLGLICGLVRKRGGSHYFFTRSSGSNPSPPIQTTNWEAGSLKGAALLLFNVPKMKHTIASPPGLVTTPPLAPCLTCRHGNKIISLAVTKPGLSKLGSQNSSSVSRPGFLYSPEC